MAGRAITVARTCRGLSVAVAIALPTSSPIRAQSPTPTLAFEVASIKRNVSGDTRNLNSMRATPDGSLMATNSPLSFLIGAASPVPIYRGEYVIGLPDWTRTERYDITVKAPVGLKPNADQQRQMWRALFIDRMKLQAHAEERERNTFALVLWRNDGTLGPQLKTSTLDCSPRQGGTAPPPPPPSSFEEYANRCGSAANQTQILGVTTMDLLALRLADQVGARVYNQTRLAGSYAVRLNFMRTELAAAPSSPTSAAGASDDPPEIFTAVQEQLGLKLVSQKTQEMVFVIDHIERPSED